MGNTEKQQYTKTMVKTHSNFPVLSTEAQTIKLLKQETEQRPTAFADHGSTRGRDILGTSSHCSCEVSDQLLSPGSRSLSTS